MFSICKEGDGDYKSRSVMKEEPRVGTVFKGAEREIGRVIRGGMKAVMKPSTEEGRCGRGSMGWGRVGKDEEFSSDVVEEDKG